MAEHDGFFAFHWKRFMRSWDDAAKTFGVAAKTLFWGVVFLSIGAAIFSWFYGRLELRKKFEWGAIGFVLPWTCTFALMLFRFFFVTPYKTQAEIKREYENKLATATAEIERTKARVKELEGDGTLNIRRDQIQAFIGEFEKLKTAFSNVQDWATPKFHALIKKCYTYLEREFPSFTNLPKKERYGSVCPAKLSKQDARSYESRCDLWLQKLQKLKSFIH